MSKTFRQSRKDKEYYEGYDYSEQEYKSKKQSRKKENRKQRYFDEIEDSYSYNFKPQKIRY